VKAGENSLPGRVAAVRVGELGAEQCRPQTAELPPVLLAVPLVLRSVIHVTSQLVAIKCDIYSNIKFY